MATAGMTLLLERVGGRDDARKLDLPRAGVVVTTTA